MAKSLSEFNGVDELDGVFTAENGSLRCSAVRLKTGGLCLFSPVAGLGEAAIASLAGLGEVEFLLAPNHYHNKGLKEYRAAFPGAMLCAPPDAQPRLEKITSLQFANLDAIEAALPDNMHLVFPQGLKTGEVWISVTGKRHSAWLVVDAFCGPKGISGELAGEPEMLGTFPKFGVGDKARYLAWVAQQITSDTPTMIVPCHGSIISSPKLAGSLKLLIKTRF